MIEVREWYVVRTKPRRESYAQEQLIRRGVETFLPRILEPGRARPDPTIGPLFPGYLFAHIDLAAQYNSVIWAPGVSRFVAFGEVPASIDGAAIEFLQARGGAEGIVRVMPTFEDGDMVRVTLGPLSGLVGVVQGYITGQGRVRVLM
jgi:transcriptional antiterminator RfaH